MSGRKVDLFLVCQKRSLRLGKSIASTVLKGLSCLVLDDLWPGTQAHQQKLQFPLESTSQQISLRALPEDWNALFTDITTELAGTTRIPLARVLYSLILSPSFTFLMDLSKNSNDPMEIAVINPVSERIRKLGISNARNIRVHGNDITITKSHSILLAVSYPS